MATFEWLTIVCLLTSLPELYTMSLGANVTSNNEASLSSLSSSGSVEMRKLRHMEGELEVLRRTVTELKAGGQCGSQRLSAYDFSPHGDILREVKTEIQSLRSQFQAVQMRRELSALRSDIFQAKSLLGDAGSRGDDGSVAQNIPSTLSTGSVYERWGHAGCPNDTEMVYSGIIGGSSYDQTGAAANALCLPMDPVLENNPGAQHVSPILGSELEVSPLPKHDLDPQCAVCRSPRPTVVMKPAANACPLGWTLEYSGYIMVGYHSHTAATEFICMDKEQQTRIASHKNENGYLFVYAVGTCGSLPCPPYQTGKVFPCVVCSK